MLRLDSVIFRVPPGIDARGWNPPAPPDFPRAWQETAPEKVIHIFDRAAFATCGLTHRQVLFHGNLLIHCGGGCAGVQYRI